jgi:hypothetical protein
MRDDALDQPGVTGRCYRIERLIGMGGAASVYEARRLGQNGPGERVACKVMHAERRVAPGFRRLVWDEAVLGLRMTAGHPNLVEVLDFFDDTTEQLCIVMELVDGVNVDQLRGPELRQPFPIVRRIAIEVLEALVHLHGRNVLYRDLSLRNILITAGGAVKVTDLGIARLMEKGLVHTSEIRGTSVYLSPEAIDRLPLDARADLFSLGAILYDLVAGQPPCGDQSMLGAIFARNLLGKFDPLPPDTPEDLAPLITGLIRPDRDARWPQTAAEALALLRGHGQPVASHEELAGLGLGAQARRDQEVTDHRPTNALPPGHVLAPRDDRDPAERPVGGASSRFVEDEARALPASVAETDVEVLPERVAETDVEVLPERVAETDVEVLPARKVDFRANLLADLVAHFGGDRMVGLIDELPANPPPGLMFELAFEGAPGQVDEHAGDAVPEHIDDVPPRDLVDRAPAPVADMAAGAQPGRVAENASGDTLSGRSRTAERFAVRRAAVMAIAGCVLLLGVLLDDGFRREQAAFDPPQRPAAPVRIAEPVLAPPVAPGPITPASALRASRHAMESADDPRHDRNRHTRSPARRRDYVPPASKWPPWVQR